MKQKSVKICPRCGSTNIGVDAVGGTAVAGGNSCDYCKDCSYGSYKEMRSFPPILTIDVDKIAEFRDEIKKNPVVKR